MPLRRRFTPRLVRSTNKRLVVICITHYRRSKGPRFGTIELAAISQQGGLPGSGFPGGATSGCEQSQQTEPYSIVSSASVSRLSEMLNPSVLAVLRLISSSNFVGRNTGSSSGLAPRYTCRLGGACPRDWFHS